MTTIHHYAQGVPCWVDLMTTDAAASAAFYSGLFGWETAVGSEDTGGYVMCSLDGLAVAGIGQIPPGMAFPPTWTTYLAVTDAHSSQAAAIKAGATPIMEVMEVIDNGTKMGAMAMIADPTGAVIGLWESGVHHGAQRVNEPGTLMWNELLTRRPEEARAFFGEFLGWTSTQIGDGEDLDYTVEYVAGGNPDGIAGIMKMPSELPETVPNYWATYFAADDTDELVAAAVAAGASVIQPAMNIAQGRFATLSDPQGAVFSIITPASH